MSSLSAHLVDDYERTFPQQIVQSGAMEYNALAHGHQQIPAFSQFTQASMAQAYRGDPSRVAASSSTADTSSPPGPDASFDRSNMMLSRMVPPVPMSYQEMLEFQQKREEEQALRTAKKVAELQAKLNQKLGPEYISQRPGPSGGPKLTYAEGWKIINLANEVFGFNGWSSSITNMTVDFIDYNQETSRFNVGVSATVKVCLRDGIWHEDVGYGLLENCKSKGMALDKCKKEAVTDALKRTLRNFGNVLGNCLYDKEYTKEILKMRVPQPRKMEPKDLHRRKEFAEDANNSGASTSTMPAPQQQRPMAPPPPPPSRTSMPSTSTSSTTAPSRPVPTASRPPTGPPKPSAPASISVTRVEDSLLSMDDDDMFADMSFDETIPGELLDEMDSGGVSFTDRSTRPPNVSSFDEAPLPVAPSEAILNKAGPSKPPPVSMKPVSKVPEQDPSKSNDRKRSIMAALHAPSQESPSPSQATKPRTSSGGGFAIPPGVSRPQRPGQSSGTLPAAPSGSTLGTKRPSEPSPPGLHGFGTARSALVELEGNGSAKRPRLS